MKEEDVIKPSVSRASSRTSGLIRLKKIPDSEIMTCIQLGIQHMVGAVDSEPDRDLLVQDFMNFESYAFPPKGSSAAPSHSSMEFKFLNYAPIAFKCFRNLFKIKTEHFISSLCSSSLRQQENPGASGSIFYLTGDDTFILKTIHPREGGFLLKLLPGYYLNLTQNPRTLLPKFFGFYSYNCLSRNIRVLVMNNLIPSNLTISQKYDLKGSTSRRKATISELKKPAPTYKDLDFLEHHPDGLFLDNDIYMNVSQALERDCRVLESFKIIDYSLLLAVHYVDRKPNVKKFTCTPECNPEPTKGIPARTSTGEELLLFIGIIDILQSYQFRKKFEHTFKALIYEKDSISVHRPDFYRKRFLNFLLELVFRPVSKKKINANPKVSMESEPSCSDSTLLDHSPLSLAWASTKLKYTKKPMTFLSEENIKTSSLRPKGKVYEKMEEERKPEKPKPDVEKKKDNKKYPVKLIQSVVSIKIN